VNRQNLTNYSINGTETSAVVAALFLIEGPGLLSHTKRVRSDSDLAPEGVVESDDQHHDQR
jgi:hypothetical protein